MSLKTTSFRARSIVETARRIEGEVLWSPSPIAFLQGVDPEKGVVCDRKSEICGKEFRDKVLVFPNAVGSSVGAYVIYRMKKNRKSPIAMINQTSDIITASGCALAAIPLYDLPSETYRLLKDSQKIIIEAKTDLITIFHR
jgi:predicted aconitase with swiveling domain